MIPPTLFFLRTAEAIRGLFWFHINFWNICSRSVKYTISILIGIALDLQIALGSMDIVMMLIVSICEHGMYFHLLVSSSISLFSVLKCYEYRSFICLGKFIPKCLNFFFIAVVNGIVFLVSLSDSSLLVYKNAIDF